MEVKDYLNPVMHRRIAMNEFVRQGPREIKKLVGHGLTEFKFSEMNEDHVAVEQVDDYILPALCGPMQSVRLAKHAVTVGNDYGYWEAGRSRCDHVDALKLNANHMRKWKEQEKRKTSETRGAFRDKVKWTLDKVNGNGIHISGSEK